MCSNGSHWHLWCTTNNANMALLHIAPVDIAGRCIVAARLRKTGYLKEFLLEQFEIFTFLGCISENLDHSTSKSFFTSHVPTRDMWVGQSKNLKRKVWGEIFCKRLSLKYSVRLPYHRRVLKAKVAALKVAIDVSLRSAATFKEVSILSDNRKAVLALVSPTARLKLVKACLTCLSARS